MSSANLNDAAWEKLFDKYNITRAVETDGFFKISSAQIREFREPRLMAKFDHRKNLPSVFSANNLSILPITRGDYIISHFDAYHAFESSDAPVEKLPLPAHIQSLDANNIPSETIALNCAVVSGIIADFTGDDNIVPTVSGRMGSGKFSFNISDTFSKRRIDVENSQIEIDAAYEGISFLSIFEAKRDLADDFLIRQLYYPFRVWARRVTKPVKPVFLVYSNGIYRLYEYEFVDVNDYNSLRLAKQKNYSIEDTAVSAADIQDILKNVVLSVEPEIPFPQADKFERVINLCELLDAQELSRADVTERYDFDARQTNYYTDAARYIGLIEKRKEKGTPIYKISESGKRTLKLGFKQRQLAYCRAILSHRVFYISLQRYFSSGNMPSTNDIAEIMRQSDLYHIEKGSTFSRRASTVKGWINWIVSLIDE